MDTYNSSNMMCSFANCPDIPSYTCSDDICQLKECVRNTETHMKAIKQWKGCKDVSKSHLILSMVGIFCMDDEHNCHHSDRNICSRHRDNLGTRFKPKETCQHPQHQGLKHVHVHLAMHNPINCPL